MIGDADFDVFYSTSDFGVAARFEIDGVVSDQVVIIDGVEGSAVVGKGRRRVGVLESVLSLPASRVPDGWERAKVTVSGVAYRLIGPPDVRSGRAFFVLQHYVSDASQGSSGSKYMQV
ncbi:hypothetical protein [Marinobacterium jannaschii]|uniref:hypothetical protein n=1 Tax=Marinobacterium jannaschii TaxID=64970 RepID=UPI000480182B|nr:hypothetical protein [Marinobacterium jannaschii]